MTRGEREFLGAQRLERRRRRVDAARHDSAVVQRAQRLDERLAGRHGLVRLQTQIVPLVAQALQQPLEGLRDVEQRRRAGGADARGEAVEHHRELPVAFFFPAQRVPFLEPVGERVHALAREVDVVLAQAAEGHGVDGAVQLRQRVQDRALQAADAALGPGLDVLDQQRRRHHVGHVLRRQDGLRHLGLPPRLHRARGPAYEREPDRADHRVHDARVRLQGVDLANSRVALSLFVLRGEQIADDGVRLDAVDENRHGLHPRRLERAHEVR
mmetsp:Transcript_10533/g.44840  ORF Transcript_10533/g.44840 Transcript_10533/m.44840 type:complete len:270 (+) Transcript_10533:1958-2767(+)